MYENLKCGKKQGLSEEKINISLDGGIFSTHTFMITQLFKDDFSSKATVELVQVITNFV
jgi:hypothetical protein